MKTLRVLALSLLTAGTFFVGCATTAKCGEGESYCGGFCLPLPSCPQPSEGAGGGSSSAGAGNGSDSCAGGGETGVEFGDTCTDGDTHSDCGCPAPICAVQPGQDEGFCTQIDCDLGDPSGSCPSGYVCTDFSAFQPDAPPICWPD